MYIGKTLAKGGFRDRILGMHIRGDTENSTLRKTLTSMLKAAGCSSDNVSHFMRTHLTVALVPVDNEALLPCIEPKLIKTLEPALCIQGLKTPNAKLVRSWRRTGSDKAAIR